MTYRHPLAFLLGLEGMALLRAYAGELPDEFNDERVAEIRAIFEAYDRGELGAGDTIGEQDAVSGYNTWSAYYDEEYNPLIEIEEPLVRKILDGLPLGRALDAACGTGRYSEYLAGLGHDVIGVDASPGMLAKARAKLPTTDLRYGDLTALPVPDVDFDLVVCALALPHVPALGPVLSEFARVLRPGGQLVLSDVHCQSLYLGAIAATPAADGGTARMPAGRFLPSDYLAAALPAGFQVRALLEPRWPSSPMQGGPWARTWAAAAVDAVAENTPAAIIWQFAKPA